MRTTTEMLLLGTMAVACFILRLAPYTESTSGLRGLAMLAIFLSAAVSNIAGFAFPAIARGGVLHCIQVPVEAL